MNKKRERILRLSNYLLMLLETHEDIPMDIVEAIEDRIASIKRERELISGPS